MLQIKKCKEENVTAVTGFPRRITDAAAEAHGVDKKYVFNHMKNYHYFFKPSVQATAVAQEEAVPPVE